MKVKNIRKYLTEEQITERVKAMGEQISKDYGGETVYLICILKGSIFFTCELAKRITSPVEIDFMSVHENGNHDDASYKEKKNLQNLYKSFHRMVLCLGFFRIYVQYHQQYSVDGKQQGQDDVNGTYLLRNKQQFFSAYKSDW